MHYVHPMESVSVSAAQQPKAEEKSKSSPTPIYNNDDLDVPTFLRNRR